MAASGGSEAMRFEFPGGMEAASAARAALADRLRERMAAARLEELRLLVTELVANSVRHARGTPIDVTVTIDGDSVRAEVSDGGEGFEPPAKEDPNPLKTQGWGLFLVRKMAERWGADAATGTVWFELDAR